MNTGQDPLHLAVALDGAGWHPAAWRSPGAEPARLFAADYWSALLTEAERGRLDFVTLEDALGLQSDPFHRPDERTDQVRGGLDAVLLAARLAPATRYIGLVPTANTTHTEPFHLAAGIATLDYAARGRAGWRPQISSRAADAALFGRRVTPQLTDEDIRDPEAIARRLRPLFAEAGDVVEAVRRLWDSWEDDAEIRDVPTGRFLDRTKLHHIDFVSPLFTVRGPSITPRPPQGQPVIASLAHASIPYEFAARSADVVFTTPHDRTEVAGVLGAIEDAVEGVGRDTVAQPLKRFADLIVILEESAAQAIERKEWLDELAGKPLASDAAVFAGSPAALADLLLDWHAAGLDGFRLRPAELPRDLVAVTRGLVPELQRRGAFRQDYAAATLRGHLGLARPVSRYAV